MAAVDERIRKTTLLESALRRPELGSIFGLAAVVFAFMLMTGPINVGLGEKNTFADCLLYTSPSPRDRQKSRMPSSA